MMKDNHQMENELEELEDTLKEVQVKHTNFQGKLQIE